MWNNDIFQISYIFDMNGNSNVGMCIRAWGPAWEWESGTLFPKERVGSSQNTSSSDGATSQSSIYDNNFKYNV